jgi:hypothetical protein
VTGSGREGARDGGLSKTSGDDVDGQRSDYWRAAMGRSCLIERVVVIQRIVEESVRPRATS